MAHIFLIDNHPAVRQGLSLLLMQEPHTICGEAGNCAETLERSGSSNADIAILDLTLGEENGLELIAGLREQGIAVLVYSMHEDAETIKKAFAAGANGYVSKCEVEDALLAAVADLLDGKRHVSPRAAQSLANRTLSSTVIHRRQILSIPGHDDLNA